MSTGETISQTLVRIARSQSEERYRIERLGAYNSEKARGIMHTPEWESLMRSEQYWFDALPKERK